MSVLASEPKNAEELAATRNVQHSSAYVMPKMFSLRGFRPIPAELSSSVRILFKNFSKELSKNLLKNVRMPT